MNISFLAPKWLITAACILIGWSKGNEFVLQKNLI